MKKLLYALCLILPAYAGSISNKSFVQKYGVDEHYIDAFAIDATTKAILDEHREEVFAAFKKCQGDVCLKKHRVYEFPWLPGYVIKKHPSRLLGMEKANKCVKDNNLDFIILPEKRVYQANGTVFIVVTKLESAEHQPLSLREIQQLCVFVEETGYNDFSRKNYIRLKNNKIAIIDTESRSFGRRRFKALSLLLTSHVPSDFEEEALKYLLQKIVQYIPENVHSKSSRFVAKKGKFSYPQIYRRIKDRLSGDCIFDWDYLAYFNEHFPDPAVSKNK